MSYRKSYLQYILNRIDFGDQAPMSFGFTDGQARLTYDLTPKHTISLSDVEGASDVDRTPFRDELGVNSVMTSGFRFSLLNLGSRYVPNQRVLITNHLAWSRERGDVSNRDNALLTRQAYNEWTWHGDASVAVSANTKNTLDFGGLFRRERQEGLADQFVYTPVLTPSLDTFRGSGHRVGGYVQQSYGFASDRVRLTAGVRRDEFSQSPVGVTSPYASAAFVPWSRTHVQFDWGQYAQFPELNQIFSVFALGPLLPERATHYEATVEQSLDERTRVRLEFYDRQDRDLLARPLLDPRILFSGGIFNAAAERAFTQLRTRLFPRRADFSSAAHGQRIHRMDLLCLRPRGDQRRRSGRSFPVRLRSAAYRQRVCQPPAASHRQRERALHLRQRHALAGVLPPGWNGVFSFARAATLCAPRITSARICG